MDSEEALFCQWRSLGPEERARITRVERPTFIKRLRDAWPFRIDDARHVAAYCRLLEDRTSQKPVEPALAKKAAAETATEMGGKGEEESKGNGGKALTEAPSELKKKKTESEKERVAAAIAEDLPDDSDEDGDSHSTDWIFGEALVLKDGVIQVTQSALTDAYWKQATFKKAQCAGQTRKTICRVCFCRKTFEEQLYLLVCSRLEKMVEDKKGDKKAVADHAALLLLKSETRKAKTTARELVKDHTNTHSKPKAQKKTSKREKLETTTHCKCLHEEIPHQQQMSFCVGAFCNAVPILSSSVQSSLTDCDQEGWTVVSSDKKKALKVGESITSKCDDMAVEQKSGPDSPKPSFAPTVTDLESSACLFHDPANKKHTHINHYHLVPMKSIENLHVSEKCSPNCSVHEVDRAVTTIKTAIESPSVDLDSLHQLREELTSLLASVDRALSQGIHTSLFAHDPSSCVLAAMQMPDVLQKWRVFLPHEKCCCQAHFQATAWNTAANK